MTLANHNFEVVKEFRYFGEDTGNSKETIGCQCYLLLHCEVMQCSPETKLLLYNILKRTMVLYGSEAWALTVKSSALLDGEENAKKNQGRELENIL